MAKRLKKHRSARISESDEEIERLRQARRRVVREDDKTERARQKRREAIVGAYFFRVLGLGDGRPRPGHERFAREFLASLGSDAERELFALEEYDPAGAAGRRGAAGAAKRGERAARAGVTPTRGAGRQATTKKDLIDAVHAAAAEAGVELTKKATGEFVDIVFRAVAGAISSEQRFGYPGFGTFTVKHREARGGTHPRTREPITIPASNTVGFKPAPALKDRVSG